MKKSTRAVLWSLLLILMSAYAVLGVLIISHGPPQFNWWLVCIMLGGAVVVNMYCAWLCLFKVIDILRAPSDGTSGRTAPLDKAWGREKSGE